jgi:hypothetical protein
MDQASQARFQEHHYAVAEVVSPDVDHPLGQPDEYETRSRSFQQVSKLTIIP